MYEPFMDFTIEEIPFIMPYFILLVITSSIVEIVQVEHKSYIVFAVAKILVYLVTYVLGRKHKNTRVYGMFLSFLISAVVVLVRLCYVVDSYPD